MVMVLPVINCCLLQLDIELIVTQNATHFFDAGVLPCPTHTDAEEWTVQS